MSWTNYGHIVVKDFQVWLGLVVLVISGHGVYCFVRKR